MIVPILAVAIFILTSWALHYSIKSFIIKGFVWNDGRSESSNEGNEVFSLKREQFQKSTTKLSSRQSAANIQRDNILIIRSDDDLGSSQKDGSNFGLWTASTPDLKFTLSNCPSSEPSRSESRSRIHGESQLGVESNMNIEPVRGLKLPGQVHTDLIVAGRIPADPYFRYEERNLSWITSNCWQYKSEPFLLYDNFDGDDIYRSSFSQSKSNSNGANQAGGKSLLYLRFDAVDTIASFYLNDELIGTSANAFHPHTFEVPASLQQQALWQAAATAKAASGVRLKIVLHSTAQEAKERAARYPYAVPATENYNVWAEPSSRNFVRKPGSDFGWDWGPAFIPMGVMGAVQFYRGAVGRLTGVAVQQQLSVDMRSASLNVRVHLESLPLAPTEVSMQVYLDGVLQHDMTVTVSASASDASTDVAVIAVPPIDISDAELWWPRGCGAQKLYLLRVVYGGTQTTQKRIGLRRVELIQKPIAATESSAEGALQPKQQRQQQVLVQPASGEVTSSLYTVRPATFYLKINGVALFMRGANYIPSDSFRTRVTADDRRYILNAAVASNMNMIRVWGGGAYEEGSFYDLADELGIMVWQEIMLACALYPRDTAFLKAVAAEVHHQSLRLGDHPSIVVWGGNNENEVALGWFSESIQNRDLYVADYSKLYADTIFPGLEAVLGEFMTRGQAVWVDSSPSNGLLSREDPYVKLWGQASTSQAGDMHFYNYNCDCEQSSSFPASRFVSEFGFQSMPSFLSYQPVTLPQDWDPNSELLLYRQRHENGNEQIDAQISRHFALPTASCSAASEKGTSSQRYFDMYLYLTGLQQSRCYETAINRWRQMRGVHSAVPLYEESESVTDATGSSNDNQMMGILYWQLNDIWQGPSWSSIEWPGRWKPLQYAVRRAYAPLSVTMAPLETTDASKAVNADNSSFFFSVYAVDDTIALNECGPLSLQRFVDVKVELISTQGGAASSSSAAGNGATAGTVVWQQVSWIRRNAASVLQEGIAISTDTLRAAKCTKQTCFLRLTASLLSNDTDCHSSDRHAHSAHDSRVDIPTTTMFMTEVKDVYFERNPEIVVSHLQQLSAHEIAFDLYVNATSPFLFLELQSDIEAPRRSSINDNDTARKGIYNTAAAGWFSDNNFLAEAGQHHSLTYTSHYQPVDVDYFTSHLQARVLQHAYNCNLPLRPSFTA